MAVLFMESFDTYGSKDAFLKRWTWEGSSSDLTYNAGGGRFGGDTFGVFDDDVLSAPLASSPTTTTLRAAMWFKTSDVPSAEPILRIYGSDSGDDYSLGLYVGTDNVIYFSVFDDSIFLSSDNSTGYVVPTDEWIHLEFEVTSDDASGVLKVWINDNLELDFSGDTNSDPGGPSNMQFLKRVGMQGKSFTTGFTYWDDIVIWDDTGTGLTGKLGPHRIDAALPDGDGASSDFVPQGGGSNYVEVDEQDLDKDTTYVESGTSGDRDLYTFPNFSTTGWSTIKGVQLRVHAKNPDTGTISFSPVAKSGTSETVGESITAQQAYALHGEFFGTDPDTGAAWTQSGINSAEFGFEVD